MCEPRSSGGTSWEVQRFICCRSSGSMQSVTQMRSVRSSTPKINTGATGGAALDLESWMGRLDLVNQTVEGQRLLMNTRAGRQVRCRHRSSRGCDPI
jgi:hypothetical protein